MSFKKSVSNEKSITNSDTSMNQMSEHDINQLRLCIHNDFSILKPTIDFSQLSHFIPSNKKNQMNETPNVSQLNSRLDEMKAKINELKAENNEEFDNNNDNNNDCNQVDLDVEHSNRLQLDFHSFKRMVNNFAQNFPIIDQNCSNCKIIDVSNEEVDKVLQIAKHIQHFQNSSQLLKSLENKIN